MTDNTSRAPNVSANKKRDMARAKLEGWSTAEIAQQTGLSKHTVAHHLARPAVKAMMAQLAAEHDGAIRRSFGRFMERLEDDINDPQSETWRESGDRVLRVIEQNDRATAKEPELPTGRKHVFVGMTELLEYYHQITAGGPDDPENGGE
jgi:hypothetical protein